MIQVSLSISQRKILNIAKLLQDYQGKRHFITSGICNSVEKYVSRAYITKSEMEESSSSAAFPQSNDKSNSYEPPLIINSSNFPDPHKLPSSSPALEVFTESVEQKIRPKENDLENDSSMHSLWERVDPRTVHRVYYFDSLAFTKKLERKGFSREQAEGCVECLLEVIGNTLDHQAKHMITKSEQKIAEQQLHSEIMSVKKDLVLLQKSEFSALRTETEKISNDIVRVESHFQDEMVKLKGQFTLDINLERGRAVEAHAANEKSVQILDNKIETEIAHLKTTYEVYRNDIFKYAAGTVLTCTTLIIGFIRLWS